MSHVFDYLKEELIQFNTVPVDCYSKFDVKRGLRNRDGSGVLAGLTCISSVVGFHKIEGDMHPVEGVLKYRGVSIIDLVEDLKGKTCLFERTVFLLLVGRLPSDSDLAVMLNYMDQHRDLPEAIMDGIKTLPSKHIMNKLQTAVSSLYGYDTDPDSLDPYENFLKSLQIIAKLPLIVAYSYLAVYETIPQFPEFRKGMSTAEVFLFLLNQGADIDPFHVQIFDLCLLLHAEHGGGNNSTFTTYVVSSSGSDIYCTLAAAIASLKGPLHGAANQKVMDMIADIKSNVSDWSDQTQLSDYLTQIVEKKGYDRSGKLYGLGHAVYTKSDPRALVIQEQARNLAQSKDRIGEMDLYDLIAQLGPSLFQTVKQSDKVISPNVDFYSGFVYDCLGIPSSVYTPIFALARSVGWCSHRIEEGLSGKRIIRPGYKFVEQK